MTETQVSDTLIDQAAAALSVPRDAPADSFALHAPLELMARVGLLPRVASEARGAARGRIAVLTEKFRNDATGAATPTAAVFDSDEDAAMVLKRALRGGDLMTVDQAASWLTAKTSLPRLQLLLGDVLVDSLAAAAHAPIALHLLSRVAALPASLLNGPLHEVARQPSWRVRWFRSPPAVGASNIGSLESRLRALPQLGRPGSDFIYPLMIQAEQSGAAAAAITASLDDDPRDVARVLARAATWSMLHDDPTQAPYGWSHCLTMAQAVMSLADDPVPRRTAIGVAGTFVVGFRVAHGLVALGSLADGAVANGVGIDIGVDIDIDIDEVITYAALHEDAHLVKYTLACLHAAELDPPWQTKYFAAAQHLANWWRNQDS